MGISCWGSASARCASALPGRTLLSGPTYDAVRVYESSRLQSCGMGPGHRSGPPAVAWWGAFRPGTGPAGGASTAPRAMGERLVLEESVVMVLTGGGSCDNLSERRATVACEAVGAGAVDRPLRTG